MVAAGRTRSHPPGPPRRVPACLQGAERERARGRGTYRWSLSRGAAAEASKRRRLCARSICSRAEAATCSTAAGARSVAPPPFRPSKLTLSPRGPRADRAPARCDGMGWARCGTARRTPVLPGQTRDRTDWTRLVPPPVLNGHVSSPPVLNGSAGCAGVLLVVGRFRAWRGAARRGPRHHLPHFRRGRRHRGVAPSRERRGRRGGVAWRV